MSDHSLSGPLGEQPESEGAGNTGNAQTGRPARSTRSGRSGERRSEAPIPSADDCLRGLGRLPALTAMGVLSPTQVNAIRASYSVILQHHQRTDAREVGGGIANPDLFELARQNPQILNLLEPILTDEQIAMLMKDREDREDREDGGKPPGESGRG